MPNASQFQSKGCYIYAFSLSYLSEAAFSQNLEECEIINLVFDGTWGWNGLALGVSVGGQSDGVPQRLVDSLILLVILVVLLHAL